MKLVSMVVLLLAALAANPSDAPAMSAADARTLITANIDRAGASVASAAAILAIQEQGPTGLPERAQQPRTMRAYWHVFIAFSVTWLLVFAYALTIGRRFGRLEEELRRESAGGQPPPR